MSRLALFFSLLVSTSTAVLAASDPSGDAFFEAKIRPVLASHCYKCHGDAAGKAQKLKGGLNLENRETLRKGGENGPVVVPGKPGESRLLEAVRYTNRDLQMPPKEQLSAEVVADLEKWIAMGAPDPRESAAPIAAAPAKKGIDLEAGRKLWAFQPLTKVQPPAVKSGENVANPIDHFILARLQDKGLTPSAPASRRVLIRRSYFDLIGLPPTIAQTDAFVNDPSPDAWPKLIDTLLASDRYGERWGRHWLDIVRFAESNGYEFDADRKGAYEYRDFVIRAFNRDMPYDQFIRWQIAGDKLLPGDYDAGAATGFIVAGPSPGQITAKTAEPLRYDQLDDVISTLGNSMLGLTIGCCRCHDHKFDPLPQRDYYRMISCFAETDSAPLKLDPDRDQYQIAEAQWKKQREPLAAAWEKFTHERMPERASQLITAAPAIEPWLVLDLDRADVKEGKSPEAKELKKLADGSRLLEKRDRKNQTLTFTATTHLKNISSLRLEALADRLLPKSGPGIGADGEFRLTKMEVRATPVGGKDKPVDVKFKLHQDEAELPDAPVGQQPLADAEHPAAPTAASKDDSPSNSAGSNFFASAETGGRSNFKGSVGYEFVAEAAIHVTALGRSVGSGTLTRSHQIDIWDTADKQSIADVIVTPQSKVDKSGFAFERLAVPVSLKKGHTYRISSGEEENGDPFVDLAAVPTHSGIAKVTVAAYSQGDGYPNTPFGTAEQGYGVPTFYHDATGIAPAMLKPAKAAKSAFFWASKAKGKDDAAVIDFEKPVGFAGGTELTITLNFETGLAIGRPRISISNAETSPSASASSQPQAMAEILALLDESKQQVTDKNREAVSRWMRAVDDETAKAYAPLAAQALTEPKENFEEAFGAGAKPGRPVYFLGRGEASKKNGLASPGFLEVLMNSPNGDDRWTTSGSGSPSASPSSAATTLPANKPGPTSRPAEPRVALAEWITDTDSGAGQLLARVIVNRLWQHHMRRGIVATPNDFGAQGDPPTHPELLDWMAGELIHNGWHLKPLQKLIMTSSVYMQAGDESAACMAVDPENKLWWRHPAQRIEAEAVRDAMLSLSGTLTDTMYGPGTLDENSPRRSIYLTVKRSKPVLFMQLFDAPEAMQSIGQRQVTTVATQALTLMNSPFVRQRAEQLAKRIRPKEGGDLAPAIEQAYRLTLCRPPTDAETTRMTAFIESQRASYAKDGDAIAFADFCQILLCSDEFVYVD